jgi:hypothetical protein
VQLLDRLIHARHVAERDLRGIERELLGTGASKRAHPAGSGGPAKDEPHQPGHEHDGQEEHEQRLAPRPAVRLDLERDVGTLQPVHQRGAPRGRVADLVFAFAAQPHAHAVLARQHGRVANLPAVDVCQEVRERERSRPRLVRRRGGEERDRPQDHHDRQQASQWRASRHVPEPRLRSR